MIIIYPFVAIGYDDYSVKVLITSCSNVSLKPESECTAAELGL